MNVKIHKIALTFFLCSGIGVFSQIKEEQLILNKKREPEVKKIEKKKTSVATIKNYPPEEKSQNPVEYNVVNVPMYSDFQTSTLQADDISPNLKTDFQNNYVRFGIGNYSKIIADANVSYTLESKMEIGADAHVLSTHGLKDEYPWDSRQSSVKAGAFLNGYADTGKYNLNVDFGQENYNYYGIDALQPASDIDIDQRVNVFQVKGFYDHFSNEYLNNVSLKSSFLTDRFGAKENKGALDFNFSKHNITIPLDDVQFNADLGLDLETVQTDFAILDKNSAKYFLGNLTPEVTFTKGKSYLKIGSAFSYLNGNQSDINLSEDVSKTYWFPRAELQFGKSDELKFYAGVDGGLQLNTYASMLQENPYLVSDLQLKPTQTKYHVYAGLRGDIDELVKYDLSVGYSKINDIMFYRSNDLFDYSIAADRAPYDFVNTFSAIYDDGIRNDVNVSLQYFPLENLSFDAGLKYVNYKLDNYDNVYNVSVFTGELGAQYTLLNKKLLLGFKAYLDSGVWENTFEVIDDGISPNYTSVENKYEKNAGAVDINLSAEYKIHKNFSIFALGNNLGGEKYEIYKAYKVLGAQIMGGVKVSF